MFNKSLSKPAIQLFFKSASCKHHIIISSWTLIELKNHVEPSEIKIFFQLISKKVIKVEYTDEEIEQSKIRSKENSDDALHIIIAEKIKADMIITRNTEHFREIGTKIPIKLPEHLL